MSYVCKVGMGNSNTYIETKVKDAFYRYSGAYPEQIHKIQNSASDRTYFRIFCKGDSVIGTFSPDPDETLSFVYLSHHFKSLNLPVPEVLYYEKGTDVYFQTDLGDTSLYEILESDNKNAFNWCKKALEHLVEFQVKGAEGIDFSKCFPHHSFDKTSVLWDLNYFKYSFLKPSQIKFHEGRLEDDFQNFATLLSGDDGSYFLYRDFQARNIMVKNEKLFFIDFQGGRKGSLCYDPASFIFSARSPFSFEEKKELLEFYKSELQKYQVSIEQFNQNFYRFLLLRVLQTFGAYGYRGWFERKQAFSEILPKAVANLKKLLTRFDFLGDYPELHKVVSNLSEYSIDSGLKENTGTSSLTVTINSFSFKHIHPEDNSGNGGGFIFDCRALPNPGKYDEYKKYSGLDSNVIAFLKKQKEVSDFNENVTNLVSQSVNKYISRGFTNLMVSFGCTGGQHRSVYCAEYLAEYLKNHFPVNIAVNHLRENEWEGEKQND